MLCRYFTVKAVRSRTMFLSAEIRADEQLALDRAIQPRENLFEFYVPSGNAGRFIRLMESLQKRGIIEWYREGTPRMPRHFH